MKANELNSQNNSITKKLYDLYLEFYKNENNFQNFNTKLKYKGYLIEAELIEQIKNIISYESLKAPFKNNITYENFKQKIEKSENINIPNLIKVSQFSNSKDLLQALNEDKKFYIINNNLLNKLNYKFIDATNIPNKNNLTFTFENNNLLLIFNQQGKEDKIYFLNKNIGLIEKSLLINNTILKQKKFSNTTKYNKNNNNSIMDKFNKINCINLFPELKPKMANTKINFFKKIGKNNSTKAFYNTERNIQLQEQSKNDIEFLLQLYFHFYNLNIQIKNFYTINFFRTYVFIN